MADFDFNHMPLTESFIQISQQVRRDFPATRVRSQLRKLAREARAQISPSLDQDQQLEELLALFYHTWGFGGAQGGYCLSDTFWLDKVLTFRKGGAEALGIIVLYLADALEIPLMPVIFPTQLILRADWLDGEMWLINPGTGETLSRHILEGWLKGNLGPGTELYEEDLREADSETVIRKLMDTMKVILMGEQQMEAALKMNELLLRFDPDDPYEVCDRGLIYMQLECDHVALTDLLYFVERCPEDPISDNIRDKILHIEQKERARLH